MGEFSAAIEAEFFSEDSYDICTFSVCNNLPVCLSFMHSETLTLFLFISFLYYDWTSALKLTLFVRLIHDFLVLRYLLIFVLFKFHPNVIPSINWTQAPSSGVYDYPCSSLQKVRGQWAVYYTKFYNNVIRWLNNLGEFYWILIGWFIKLSI